MIRFTHRRWLSVALLLVAVASLGLSACQAAMETKKGALGEFCNNRDTDCREGLVCDNGVCGLPNQAISDACQQVCGKLDTCGVQELNCMNDCRAEIQNWGESVVEAFAECVVNDLSCQEVGDSANSAAQTCYNRLPLDEQRRDRCRTLVEEVQSCQPNTETQHFQSQCIYMARTTSDEVWGATDECAQAAEFGTCAETTECINTVFDLNEDL